MKKLLLLFALLFVARASYAQGVRYDAPPITQLVTVANVSNIAQIPLGLQIQFCNAPANAVPCTNRATTYTDSTTGTSCLTSTQIVLQGTTSCVANPDSLTNWGVWVTPGQYAWTASVNGANYGPFFVTISASNVVPSLSGTNTWTGTNTFNGLFNSGNTATFTGALNSTNTTTGISDCLDNGRYVAGSTCYATIVAAENAACAVSPSGMVYIPATYAGTDAFSYQKPACGTAGYPAVQDMRRWATASPKIYTVPFPATDSSGRSLPLGVDLDIYSAGASDHHFTSGLLATTTSATISIGLNSNVAVGAVTCPNCEPGFTLPFSGVSNFYIGAGLVIGAGTTNWETIPSGSWSFGTGGTLTFTAAKSHSGTTDIWQQMGANFFDGANTFIFDPSQPANGTNCVPDQLFDGFGNFVAVMPCNSSAAFPFNAWQFFPPITGMANSFPPGTPANLRFQNADASHGVQILKSTGAALLGSSDSTGITSFNNLNVYGGSNLTLYSDAGSTQQAQIAAATGAAIFNGLVSTKLVVADLGSACTNAELALSGGWQSTGSATVTAVAGVGQTCSWTITTGTTTSANPTVTDTLTNALPNASIVCEMNVHGGTHTPAAGEGFFQSTLSATAPVFTFNGTPTANGFTYLVTRRCGP